MRRLLPLLLTGLLLTPAAATASVPTANAEAPPLAVTGYALSDLKAAVLDREAPALATVGVDGVTLSTDGADVASPSAEAYALARRSQTHDLRAELLVSNFSGDDFSPAVGHRLLSSKAHRDAVAAELAGFVGPGRFDGIAVDLESLRAEDKDGLTAFVRTLRDELPAGASISIDLMASTTTAGYADGGYDLAALADVVDVVALMAYDQHGPTWSGPGPVGGLTWQRKALTALTAVVPAEQVDLGVAGYGYYWPRTGKGHAISVRQARSMVAANRVRAVWNGTAGEWTATLPNGTRLWWSDRRSWDARVTMAGNRQLHGLALWRLGSADSIA